MQLTYMTSATFNQNPSRAKKAADEGPVVITDHGDARYVLVSYEAFEGCWKRPVSLFDSLQDPHSVSDRNFEPERISFGDRDFAR